MSSGGQQTYADIAAYCPGCDYPQISCRCRQVHEFPTKTKATVPGVGPDAKVVANAKGGRQSNSPYALDSLPFKAVLAVSTVLKQGREKYGKDNWRLISRTDHLNHAMAHICAYFAKDEQDDHLEHAATRLLFALETTDEQEV